MNDVWRSVARYTSLALPDFEVVMAVGEGEASRPYARVVPSTPVASSPHGARHVELIRGFAITAFPTSFPVTPTAALTEAERVAAKLREAFGAGIQSEFFHAGRRHPKRVPLYDYDGVPFGSPAVEHVGFARVLDLSVGALADPADENLYVVVADVRLGWSEGIAAEQTAPLVEGVTLHPEA